MGLGVRVTQLGCAVYLQQNLECQRGSGVCWLSLSTFGWLISLLVFSLVEFLLILKLHFGENVCTVS